MIIIDTREKHKNYFFEQLAKDGREVIIDQLDMGDFLVMGDVASYVIERKAHGDFASSIIDGRLFRQASDLASLRKFGFSSLIIVEGTIVSITKHTDISRRAIHGAIHTLYSEFGIPVLFFSSRVDTVMHLELLDDIAGGLKKPRARLPVRKPKFKCPDENRVAIVAMLPNIGVSTAKKLLEKYGSVRRVFELPLKDFAMLRYITPAKAREIYEVINGDYTGGCKDDNNKKSGGRG